ncbi:Putative Sensor histidine kinase YycG [Candidatus Phycorickettsia trachydisci]|uniref:Sensor histidine kinase YycG n=1 Tax=Candidatus Phycorickettsia trachydisci TaxID=2115978 RepID=A0A2P1P984_9RICK|nr:hypothetical protein [Candidatus Phycorickettsia trachydisci]AVP87842.1 Putative Sensor histidine kinase YycG [Candidatus Phycorickettsia trachydisci]
MNFNIDSIIFIGFLLTSVLIGLFSSYGVRTIREYAIGNKNFTTATIAATIVATWASGNAFFGMVEETYKNGLYQIFSDCADVICMFSIGIILAPRMSEFLDKLSIAEAMGSLYGKYVRIITAIAGLAMAAGIIAAQLQVAGLIFSYSFNCPIEYGVIIGGIIMGLYSTWGGVRSVTFTDVIQLVTFATMVPTLAFFIFDKTHVTSILASPEVTRKFFSFGEVFNFTNSKSLYYACLFLFNGIPSVGPAFFQRIAIAKDTKQITKSFVIAGFIWLFIILSIDFVSLLTFASHPDLAPTNVVKFIIFEQSYPGLRGFILAGIMAMIISTADSYNNSASVLFVHDFCKPLGIKITRELLGMRITSAILVLVSIKLALSSGIGQGYSLIRNLIAANTFYMPIVTVPFLLAIFGFRSSGKAVLIGMIAGAITVLIWGQLLGIQYIPSIIPGMIANMTFLFASHYLLKQEGGWVGIKDLAPLIAIREERSEKIQRFITSLRGFNLSKFIEKNSPNNQLMYIYTGLFCCISLYANIATIDYYTKLSFPGLFQFITPSVLLPATALLSYPLWPNYLKEKEAIAHIAWNIVAFYGLICTGFLLTMLSSFDPFHVMLLTISIIIVAMLVRWQWAITMTTSGILSTFLLTKHNFPSILSLSSDAIKLQIMYLLVLTSGLLIVFIKPKQEQETLLTSRVNYLRRKILAKEEEMMRTLSLLNVENNVQTRRHKPLNDIIFISQMLFDFYDGLSGTEKQEAAKIILKSFVRLENFESNIANLSKLTAPNLEFANEEINFAGLISERLKICRNLYEEEDSKREFVLSIDKNIKIIGDRSYLEQMIDNLIINAIVNCSKGIINISLEKLGTKSLSLRIKIA